MVDKVIAIPRNKITSQVIPCSSRLSFLLLRRARALRLPLLGFSFQLGLQLFGMCGVVGFPTSIDGLPRKGGRVGGVEVLATVPASLPAESHGCVINHGPSIAPKRCVSFVPDRKLDDLRAKSPVPVEPDAGVKPWRNFGEMRRVFEEVREQVGETRYLEELELAGVQNPSQFQSAGKALECYWRLARIAAQPEVA